MFKKSNRVKKQLFPNIIKKGKVYYSKHFTLRVVQTQVREDWKISVVISKKTEHRAVKRNQLRRRLTHALRETMVTTPFFTGVFFVKKGAFSLSFRAIKNELSELLRSVRVYN